MIYHAALNVTLAIPAYRITSHQSHLLIKLNETDYLGHYRRRIIKSKSIIPILILSSSNSWDVFARLRLENDAQEDASIE